MCRLGLAAMAATQGGTLIGAEAGAVKPKAPWRMGCYTRVFDQFDYPVALDGIAEAGFKYVGFMTTRSSHGPMIKPEATPEQVQALHEQARRRGLSVLSVYGEFSVSESHEAGIRELKELIDHTARCQCPNLLLGGTTDESLYESYYRAVRACCEYAATQGIGLTIKPHGGQNATGPQCRKAIERVGQANFRLWYDPGNILYYSDGKQDPVADAATVNGLVVGMSVKDFLPPKEVLVNIGEGKVDFPAVLARLKKGGFTHGPLIVECVRRGSLESVKAAAKQARVFLEKLTGQQAG